MLKRRKIRIKTSILIFIPVVFFSFATDVFADDYLPGDLIIYIESDYWPVSVSKAQGGQVITGLGSLDTLNAVYNCISMEKIYKGKAYSAQGYYLLKFPITMDMDSVAFFYEEDVHVRFASPNYLIAVNVVPNDSLYPFREEDPARYQWAHDMYHMMSEGAWDIERGDSTVAIQVIDTGIDWRHPDLVSSMWQNQGEDYEQDGHTIELIEGRWQLDPGDRNEADDDSNGYPDDLEALKYLGFSLLSQDKWQESSDTLEKLVTLFPHDKEAWSYLSIAYTRLGKKDKAEEALKKSKQ
jgi:tetratricopeptide (TPR) repeat protein